MHAKAAERQWRSTSLSRPRLTSGFPRVYTLAGYRLRGSKKARFKTRGERGRRLM